MSDFAKLLPYETPASKRDAAMQLAEIVGVPKNLVPQDADYNKVVAALAGLVLFRHLERHQRHEVMVTIHLFELTHRPFYGQLQGKIAHVIAYPRWQNWSLTNDELQRIASFHNSFGRFSGFVGTNPGALGVAGSTWNMIKQGLTKGNIVGFALSATLWGMGEASYSTEKAVNEELDRRRRTAPINENSPLS